LKEVKMKKLTWVLLGIVLLFWLLIAYTQYGIHHYEVGVVGFKIGFGCSVDVFPPELQWVTTVVIACPGTDMIRIWPLPVVHPWIEDRDNGIGVWL
jgi:hypothetical protein